MQNLIIYNFKSLYDILEEISFSLNFKIYFAENEDNINKKAKKLNNYLIISKKKNSEIKHSLLLHDLPVKIFELIEKINTEFLKLRYNKQSKIKLKNYIIDLNSREMVKNNAMIKLTEKEIYLITYLSNVNKPVGIDELQKKVWNYQNDIETHTVETHIYRLRKKISDKFNDDKFIVSEKNGYHIK